MHRHSSICSSCAAGEASAVPDPSVWQTIGPFFPTRLAEPSNIDLTELRGRQARGTRITLSCLVLESGRQPVRNAIIEIWQPDAEGLFRHPADPRADSADPNFLGWGRCATDGNGWYRFRTIMPGQRRDNTAGARLPHINMMLLASGIMRRLTTTVFFGDGPDNVEDPVLAAVPPDRRRHLFARRAPELDRVTDEAYRFDVVIQGADETPFFAD
jgi:protocatechuate 3,4-dioxygenase alpha subunit